MNPFVFCGGSTSDPITAGYWQVPLVKALAEKRSEPLSLALVAMDIPISRQGIDHMEQLAGKLGIKVVDKQAIPPAADVSGAASRIMTAGQPARYSGRLGNSAGEAATSADAWPWLRHVG